MMYDDIKYIRKKVDKLTENASSEAARLDDHLKSHASAGTSIFTMATIVISIVLIATSCISIYYLKRSIEEVQKIEIVRE